MRRTAAGSLAALLLLFAACATPGGSPSSSAPPSDGAEPSAGPSGGGGIEHPEGDEAVLVVSYAGGFAPIESTITAMPHFVMLGDGRILTQGAVPAIFPGPALPAVLERTLTPDGIQAILEAVEETGLFTTDLELRGAAAMVADASDTIFQLNAAGRRVTITVYALGLVMDGMEPPPGMTSAEVDAHRVLSDLHDALQTIDTSLEPGLWESEGWQPFEPSALRLYVRDASGEPPVDPALGDDVRDWPGDDEPATFGAEVELLANGTRCGAVEGEAAAAWLAALSDATQITQWSSDGTDRYSVLVRPLLPYEEVACPT